jgi:hypothetical protein
MVPAAADWDGAGDDTEGDVADGAAGVAHAAAAMTTTAIRVRICLRFIVPSARSVEARSSSEQ